MSSAESRKAKLVRRFSGDLKKREEETVTDTLSVETHYHDDGKVSKEIRYSHDGEVEEEHQFIYDERGNLIEHNWVMPVDEIEQSEKTTRNDDGKVIREVKMYYGEEGESTEFDYDDKKRLVEVRHFDEEGVLIQQEKLEYDSNDKVSKGTIYDGKGKMLSSAEYIYNEKGLLQQQKDFDGSGQLVTETVVTTDEKGNEVSLVQYNAKRAVTQRIANTYDDQNRLVKKLASAAYTRIYTYEYDDAGRVIDELTTDENGNMISRNSYQYNDDGKVEFETSYEMDLTHSGRDLAVIYRYEYEY